MATSLGSQVPDNQGRPGVIVLAATALRITAPREPSKYRDGWKVLVRCPFCGATHEHGWRALPDGELKPQRMAHCHGSKRSKAFWERGTMEYRIDASVAEATYLRKQMP